jgi:hypothetical protein
MSDLTTELNLALAVDNDDLADYLVLAAGLRGSLVTVDGLFNSGTGHNHNGAHQGGALTAIPGSALVDGSVTSAKIQDNTIQTADIADGAVTSAKLAAGSLLPESLFAGTSTNQSTNYTVAATIMWVFCTAAITVTLPAAASTNRPITVAAITGNSTVTAVSGSVVGGSVNTTTGAVTNGGVTAGDAFTYRSDGTNWRAV